MKRLIFQISFLVAGILLLSNCNKENFDLDRLSTELELQPELVAPLIYGSMSMSDITALFDSVSYIDEDPEGLIILVYGDTLISVAADTMIVPDLETEEFYLEADVDVPEWIPIDTLVLARRTRSIDFVMEGENDRLDEVFIKGGELRMDLESTLKHTGYLTVSSEQILDKEGIPISNTVYIDDLSGNFEQTYTMPSDSFMLRPLVRNDSNLIFFDFDLTLINSGQAIIPGEHLIVQAGLTSADFYHVFGFIDSRNLVDESGDMDIPLWEDNPDLKAITFADPGIEITSITSFGIPLIVEFDSVIATGAEGDQVTLTMSDGNELEFLAPGFDQMGETVTTSNLIDQTSSNLPDFLAVAPSNISYRVMGRTAVSSETTHFILNESEMDLVVELLLPLDFKSSGFALTDTMDFEVGDAVDTSMVRNAEISLTTLNELPLELEVQVLLLDEFYTVLDSLFDDERPLLGASQVDAEGKLVDAVEEINTVEFPLEKLAKLEQVQFIQVRAKLTTSDEGEPFVKIYSHYTLDFKISMLANLRINSEEL